MVKPYHAPFRFYTREEIGELSSGVAVGNVTQYELDAGETRHLERVCRVAYGVQQLEGVTVHPMVLYNLCLAAKDRADLCSAYDILQAKTRDLEAALETAVHDKLLMDASHAKYDSAITKARGSLEITRTWLGSEPGSALFSTAYGALCDAIRALSFE